MTEEQDTQDTSASKWVDVISAYEMEFGRWEQKGKEIVKRYLDNRGSQTVNRRRFNILWSNVQTLLPALYFSNPKPNIERRYAQKDQVSRISAEVLERACAYFINDCDFGYSARLSVQDRLLPGRGVMWFRYKPHFRDMEITGNTVVKDAGVQVSEDADLAQETQEAEEPVQEVEYEEVVSDYKHWQDFGHNLARTWEEVTCVWSKNYLSMDELKARWPDKAESIPLDYVPQSYKKETQDKDRKATIYEVWDKTEQKVVWLHKSLPNVLEELPDPLKLKHFFPCPRPLYATLGNDTLVPTPDYVEYQDQAAEMDELTARISSITKSIKVAGVYDASAPGIANILSEGIDNRLIAVESWAMFAEKGGIKGAVDWFPIEAVLQALLSLYEARERVKNDLYEISGIADVIRGATDPRETATAQKIKGQFASLRLSDSQNEVARFMRDGVQIMAEIIGHHFSPKTLAMITGYDLFETNAEKEQAMLQAQQAQQMGQPVQDNLEKLKNPTWEEIMPVLRDKAALHFKIAIETDSTIKQDQDGEKAARMEAIQAIGGFLQQAASAPPQMLPLLGEMLRFGIGGFKAARPLESAIEDFITKMQQSPPAPPEEAAKGPDPAALAQVAQIKAQGQVQAAEIKAQSDIQAASIRAQSETGIEQMKVQAQKESDMHKIQADLIKNERNAQIPRGMDVV